MQTKLYTLLLFLLLAQFAPGQNLVPNPSFEDTVECPQPLALVSKAEHWYGAEQSPDYFNECVSNPFFTVPDNQFDFQYAATGVAYCGFYLYNTIDTTYQEKIGVELLSSLNIGARYFVSFKINATSHSYNGANNKIGVLFSTFKYSDSYPSSTSNYPYPPTNDFSHMWTDSIITDTTNWVQVVGSFIADSAYTHLTIGNFFTNAHTDTLRFWQTNALISYYFIDDVCVSEDSILCVDNPVAIKTLKSRKRELTIYPNPANNYLSVITETEVPGFVELYSTDGEVLLKHKIPQGHYETNADVTQINSGIYFFKFTTSNKTISQKIIIHH